MFCEQNELTSPSVGRIGEAAYDPKNDRIKGFLLPPAYSVSELGEVMTRHVTAIPEAGQVSRITVRVLTGADLTFSELSKFNCQLGGKPVSLDGAIPLPENPLHLKYIAYFGGSNPDRLPSAEVIAAERLILSQAQTEVKTTLPSNLPEGYTVQLKPSRSLEGLSEADVNRLVEIYTKTFTGYLYDFNVQIVKDMAHSAVVGLVRDPTGKIVSVTMGEIIPPLAGVKLAEISDSATDPLLKEADPQAKNVNFWAKEAVLRHLVNKGADIVYTESRAGWKAVLRANSWLGLTPCGYLPRSCIMGSERESVPDPENNGFGNLVIMALLPEDRHRYIT